MNFSSNPVRLPWVVMPADTDSFGPEFRAGALAAAKQERFSRIRFGVSLEMLSGEGGALRCAGNPIGLICHAQDLQMASGPNGYDVPSVMWGDGPVEDWTVDADACVSVCAVDNRAVGRMAADYFLKQRRFRSFVYVDSPVEKHGAWWRETRFQSFRGVLREAGADRVVHFELTHPADDPVVGLTARLLRLPGPVAVFACSDRVARDVLALCEADGVVVPDAVAVLGVDDDKGVCESADLPISSIRIEYGRLGRMAMGLELRMLARNSGGGQKLLLKPLKVVERSSTNCPAPQDVFVRRAWDFICISGSDVPSVAQVVLRSGASRSYLERKFREEMGRTILEVIHSRQLELIKLLVLETDKSVTEIAESVGLSASGLCTFFKRMLGLSIGEFRLAHGLER